MKELYSDNTNLRQRLDRFRETFHTVGRYAYRAGAVHIELIVVEEEDALRRRSELLDDMLEDLAIGLQQSDEMRCEVVREMWEQSHLLLDT
jgi:hypothetical protein